MSSWESAAIRRAKEVNDKMNALDVLVGELSALSVELLNDILSAEAITIVNKYKKGE